MIKYLLTLMMVPMIACGGLQQMLINPSIISAGGGGGLTPDFWLKLDEGTGSSVTETINGYTASISGTVTWVTGRKGGTTSALSFSGSSTYIQFGTTGAINNWTEQSISFWVKAGGPTAQFSRILEKGANSEWTIASYYSADYFPIMQNLGGSGPLVASATSINDGNWHNLLFTIASSGTVTVYFDGVFSASANAGPPGGSKTGVLTVGYYGGLVGPYFWNGPMQDVEIFNRVLTSTEAAALYLQ